MPFFELESCIGLFEKAKQDFVKLEQDVNSHDLFNFLCTVGHLPEWINKERGLPREFRREASRLSKTVEMKIIQALCSRAKHFRKKQHEPTTKTSRWFAQRISAEGELRLEEEVGKPVYEVQINEKMVDVVELCRGILGRWQLLFTRHHSSLRNWEKKAWPFSIRRVL